jgi:adenine phosphoribosyltransferase
MHVDAIKKGERVVIVDDLIATGGTLSAATQLVEQLEGDIVECAIIIDLPDLKGKDKIKDYKVFTLMEFEGE